MRSMILTLYVPLSFFTPHSRLFCHMRLMWMFVLYVLTASSGLFFAVAMREQLLCITMYSCFLAVTYRISVVLLHFSTVALLLQSWRCAVMCSWCRNVQFPGGRLCYGKRSTEWHSTWPIRHSALIKIELQIAPGIWSPQLPTCVQFCCSYIIFYGAFVCVYRNNKAIFLSLYGLSQEHVPDVICFHLNISMYWVYMSDRSYCKRAACIQYLSWP